MQEISVKTIKPLKDKVIIELDEAATVSEGGILIPSHVQERPGSGVVRYVGKRANGDPLDVSVGDSVIFGRFTGTELNVNNKVHVILGERDIIGVEVEDSLA